MPYPLTEQETTIVYDHFAKEYTIYTTVPKHIRRLQKKGPMFELLDYELDSKGEHLAIKVRGPKLPPASTFN